MCENDLRGDSGLMRYVSSLKMSVSCYITFHGKRDSADVIILRTLRWEDYSEFATGTRLNHKGPLKWARETEVSQKAVFL